MKVDVLGPDAAMRTFTARLEGTYKGKPTLRHRHHDRQDGQWKERFSDHRSAALAPPVPRFEDAIRSPAVKHSLAQSPLEEQ